MLVNRRAFLKTLDVALITPHIKTCLEAPILPCYLHEAISRILKAEPSVDHQIRSGSSSVGCSNAYGQRTEKAGSDIQYLYYFINITLIICSTFYSAVHLYPIYH